MEPFEDDELTPDDEDARQAAYWTAEAHRYHPDADAMADREADRWERSLWRDA